MINLNIFYYSTTSNTQTLSTKLSYDEIDFFQFKFLQILFELPIFPERPQICFRFPVESASIECENTYQGYT